MFTRWLAYLSLLLCMSLGPATATTLYAGGHMSHHHGHGHHYHHHGHHHGHHHHGHHHHHWGDDF